MVHDHLCQTPNGIVRKAKEIIDGIAQEPIQEGRIRQDLNIEVWQGSTNNSIKLNIDASFDVRTAVTGLGVVARDEKGDVKLSAVARMDNIQSPLYAEVMAILFGVKLLKNEILGEFVLNQV